MNVDHAAGGLGEATSTELSGQDLSRRAFMRSAGGAVAVVVAGTLGITQIAAGPTFAAPTGTDREQFERCVGKTFTNKTSGTRLTLAKVRSLRFSSPEAGNTDSFSLLFRGPADRQLAQGVYTLHHRVTGNRSLLVTPLQAEPNACFYEVIFNRAVPR